ncbi:hypothetical protein GOFOIKOB_6322 [Methylobacterium tardum]|nr:hypothetical protein GOFOIKOB_6322 [Methylobacterium tardum]
MGDLVDRGGGLLHGGELLLHRGRLLLRRGADLGRGRTQVGGGGPVGAREIRQPRHHRVQRRAEAADLAGHARLQPSRQIALADLRDEGHDAHEGTDDQAVDGDPDTRADQERQQGAAPQGDALVALCLRDTSDQRGAHRILKGLDGRELLAHRVEELLAFAVRLDADRFGPGRRVGRIADGRLADVGLPAPRGGHGVGQETRALGIVADHHLEPADGLIESQASGPVRLQAALAPGEQVAAQPGLLIEHGGPEIIEAAGQLTGAVSGVRCLLQLVAGDQDRAAAEDRH